MRPKKSGLDTGVQTSLGLIDQRVPAATVNTKLNLLFSRCLRLGLPQKPHTAQYGDQYGCADHAPQNADDGE
jgi:hypothetical protein